MATERQAPDAVLASANLSNGLTEIDEDPDSPDGNWMVASGNNVDTDVRTSFPTPTGSPTVGAGLQEFKAWVRQFDEGQSGTPEVHIELWENGGLVRAGSKENVTTSGHMVTFTWNASELGTADGSLVECKVVGTKSGGSPGARNTVDVGAVEWNVTYSTGGTVTGAGVSAGVSTAAGNGVGAFVGAGVSASAAAPTGNIVGTIVAAGATAAVAAVSGNGVKTAVGAGLAAGAATVAAALTRVAAGGAGLAVMAYRRFWH